MHNAIFKKLSFDFTSTFRYCLGTWLPTKGTLKRADLTPLFSSTFCLQPSPVVLCPTHSTEMALTKFTDDFHRSLYHPLSVLRATFSQLNALTCWRHVLSRLWGPHSFWNAPNCAVFFLPLFSPLIFSRCGNALGLCSETNFSVSPPCIGHHIISHRYQRLLQPFCFSKLAS